MKKFVFLLLAYAAALTGRAQVTVVIQPHFAQGTENTVARVDNSVSACIGHPFEHYADSNFTVIKEFDAITWTASGCPDYFRGVLRFDELKDPTVIPTGATITSARLVLYGVPSSVLGNYGNSYYPATPYSINPTWLYELADTFDHHAITWNNQPSVMHVDSITIVPSASRWNETDTVDVTAMVTDMVTNVNTGFLFKLQDETIYRERMYAGCYHPDSTLHPKLIVTFTCVPSITDEPLADTVLAGDTATFSVTSSAVSATYQWQEDPGTGFVNLANVWPYSGVDTKTLTIQDASLYLNLTHYRCLVMTDGACTDTSSSAILVIHGGLGVNETRAGSFSVFPNPAHDNVVVGLPAIATAGNIEFIDELGRVVVSKKISGHEEKFDVGTLPAGIYFLKITCNGQVVYKKLIKE